MLLHQTDDAIKAFTFRSNFFLLETAAAAALVAAYDQFAATGDRFVCDVRVSVVQRRSSE